MSKKISKLNPASLPLSGGELFPVTQNGQTVNTTLSSIKVYTGGGSGGAVNSVFGRTGAVSAQSNDYTFAQIGSKPTSLAGYNITDAVSSVFGRSGAVTAQANDYTFAQIGSKPTSLAGYNITDAVSSVFGRSGAVIAQTNDYTFAQIGSKPTSLGGYGITDAAPLSHVGTGGNQHALATLATPGFMTGLQVQMLSSKTGASYPVRYVAGWGNDATASMNNILLPYGRNGSWSLAGISDEVTIHFLDRSTYVLYIDGGGTVDIIIRVSGPGNLLVFAEYVTNSTITIIGDGLCEVSGNFQNAWDMNYPNPGVNVFENVKLNTIAATGEVTIINCRGRGDTLESRSYYSGGGYGSGGGGEFGYPIYIYNSIFRNVTLYADAVFAYTSTLTVDYSEVAGGIQNNNSYISV